MKKKLLILLILLLRFSSYAQKEVPRFQKEVKLNVPLLLKANHLGLGNLAPVFIMENRAGKLHEFELSWFSLSRDLEEDTNSQGKVFKNIHLRYNGGLRYQYTHMFSAEKRISPFIGGAISTIWYSHTFKPMTLMKFPSSQVRNTNALELIPGFRWRLSERVGVDVSIILNAVVHKFNFDKIENPALPLKYWRNWNNELYVKPFEQLHTRFGLFVKL
ncbi:hypothetical protein [Nafulsella turpanensis]|uniref:hypothetical protein n=1 Tax=Nafulsella turpanensis TaxID=1265690 RepID=UPI0012682357|nr:hypothetical protein [Nafulsella turpanensis]